MAGDWVKMLCTLPDNPKVDRIAERLGIDPMHAMGCLMACWSWAGSVTESGRIKFATRATIDKHGRRSGLAEAMEAVEWLVVDENGVRFPKWDGHNSNGAKARALKSARQSKWRKSATDVDASVDGAASTPPSTRAEQSSREQAKSKTMLKSNALPEFNLGDDACSLLRTVGMDEGGIRFLLGKPGVDDGQVHWACERLRDEITKARRGKRKPIANPAGYVRQLIETKRPPQGWRDEWNRKRLAEQAAKVGGLKIAGG